MQQKESIRDIEKQESDQFPFLLRIGDHCNTQTLNNMFTGDPTVPLIGKYSRNQYHFLTIDALIQFDINLDEDKQLCEQYEIQLPNNVLNILNNIPDKIIHNKPPPKEGKKQGNKKQKKNNKQKSITQFFQQKQEQEIPEQEQEQQENHEQQQQQQQNEDDFQIMQFHPLQFNKSNKIKFTWTISSLQNKKILEPLKQEPCLSYVNHNWVFEILDFSKQKKIISHLPICVVNPIGVFEYNDQYKGLSFNGLRTEYMSVHLGPQGSLCYSPNNMKLFVDMKQNLISFYTIILQEDGYHQVNYHWIILNDVLSELSHNLAKQALNLNMLIASYQDLAPEFKNIQLII